MEGLEERLSSATQNPASPDHRLARMVADVTQMQVRICLSLACGSVGAPGWYNRGRCSSPVAAAQRWCFHAWCLHQAAAAPDHSCTHTTHNISRRYVCCFLQGRAVIVVEVTRPSPATTPQQLANLAKTAIACGADALCVRLDTEDTPEGLKDLFAVVQVGGSMRGSVVLLMPVQYDASSSL